MASVYHYTWKARYFDNGYYVSFTYHDYPSKWRDQDWQVAVRRSVVATTQSDFKSKGLIANVVFLSAGMQQGGGVGVGMLIGDKDFCSRWEQVDRLKRASVILQGEHQPWILSSTGNFDIN